MEQPKTTDVEQDAIRNSIRQAIDLGDAKLALLLNCITPVGTIDANQLAIASQSLNISPEIAQDIIANIVGAFALPSEEALRTSLQKTLFVANPLDPIVSAFAALIHRLKPLHPNAVHFVQQEASSSIILNNSIGPTLVGTRTFFYFATLSPDQPPAPIIHVFIDVASHGQTSTLSLVVSQVQLIQLATQLTETINSINTRLAATGARP